VNNEDTTRRVLFIGAMVKAKGDGFVRKLKNIEEVRKARLFEKTALDTPIAVW
jgi:hypothetical protein